jgi:platelet-activating factor acetylhydrolase IB subunit alpha
VRGVALHHSGKFIYSCSDDKSIRIWDLNTGKCTKKIQDAHTHFVSCVASNLKYLMIATGSVDNNIKLWECK